MNTDAHARIRRTGRIGGATAVITALTVFGLAVPAHAVDPVTLNILTVNDFHGYLDPGTATGPGADPTLKFAGTIERLRQADGAGGANTLLIGAGDFIGASQFASDLQQDQPTIDMFNELGLVASAVGNHEFDKGWDDLRDRVIAGGANAQWDYLGANVYEEGTQTPILPEYGLYEAGGLTVGVIGAVTQETPALVSPGGVLGIEFGDPVEAINRVAGQLTDRDPGNGEADVLIATLHEGGGGPGTGPEAQTLDQQIAASEVFASIVNDTSPKVAAIVGGHTHQLYAYKAPVPGQAGATRPVIQTGNYGNNVGQITLTVDRDTNAVTASTGANVPRDNVDKATLLATYPALGPVNDTLTAAFAEADIVGNQPVGTLTAPITTAMTSGPANAAPFPNFSRDDRSKESTLGTLVADSILSTLAPAANGGAQLTFVNPGGLRNELVYTATSAADSDGTILYREANAILPFVNNLATVDMTGALIKTLLEQQWQRDASGNVPSRSYLALSTSTGFSYTFDASLPEGSRITSMVLNGTPIDPAATYRVGTFTFLTGTGSPASAGGDNFRAFRQATNFKDSGLIDRDAWIAYLEANQPVSPDFRKHSISVTGLNTAPAGGDVDTLTVGAIDLTSINSPANTTIEASFAATADGTGAVAIGNGTVSAGGSTFDVTWPVSSATAGYLILTAQPTGTRSVIPVTLAAPAATVTATAAPVEYGTAAKIAVTVTAPAQTVAGEVSVQDAGGTILGTATLVDGKATVRLGRTALPPGTHTLTVAYGGSPTAQQSTTTVDLVVNKASSDTIALSPTLLVKKGAASNVLVITVANGLVPVDGPVTIEYNGTTVGTGALVKGSARIAIEPFTTRGLKSLTVTYGGSDTVEGSTATARVLVY